ncbi:MAG: hypothetical protein ACYDAE_18820 [Steroidobacteraceae bacterium]
MIAKHAFNRARTFARDIRLPVPVTRSRNRLVAVWSIDPLSGRLELKWQPVGRAENASDLPSRRGPANRPDALGGRRRSTAPTLAALLTQEAAA